jgi:hypothetical protein
MWERESEREREMERDFFRDALGSSEVLPSGLPKLLRVVGLEGEKKRAKK